MKVLFSSLFQLALVWSLMALLVLADHTASHINARDVANHHNNRNNNHNITIVGEDGLRTHRTAQDSQDRASSDPLMMGHVDADATNQDTKVNKDKSSSSFNLWTYIRQHNCSLSEFPFCPALWDSVKTDFIDSSSLSLSSLWSSLSSYSLPFTSTLLDNIQCYVADTDKLKSSMALSIISAFGLGYVVIKLVEAIMNRIF